MPDINIDDYVGDMFAARFGEAWSNGENFTFSDTTSLFSANLETDPEGMMILSPDFRG
jgi:hypothetical protein